MLSSFPVHSYQKHLSAPAPSARFSAQPQTQAQLAGAVDTLMQSATEAAAPRRVKELVAQYTNQIPELALGLDYDRLSEDEIESRMAALSQPGQAESAKQRLVEHSISFINTLIAEGFLKPATPAVIRQVAEHNL